MANISLHVHISLSYAAEVRCNSVDKSLRFDVFRWWPTSLNGLKVEMGQTEKVVNQSWFAIVWNIFLSRSLAEVRRSTQSAFAAKFINTFVFTARIARERSKLNCWSPVYASAFFLFSSPHPRLRISSKCENLSDRIFRQSSSENHEVRFEKQ